MRADELQFVRKIPAVEFRRPSYREKKISISPVGGFIVSFAYDALLVAAVKKIEGARYDSKTRTWRVPENIVDIQQMLEFASSNNFNLEAGIEERIAEINATLQKNLELSEASGTDVQIAGLGGELMPFQKVGVVYASRVKRCLIADQPGLGKTMIALATIQNISAYPALVVCPASVKLNWQRETRKWLVGKKTSVINGYGAGYYRTDIVIINYDILTKHIEALKNINFKAIVLDESHYVKSSKTQRTKVCRELSSNIPIRLLLTGTPILNKPKELISQLQIIDRLDDFGGWWRFVNRYCAAFKGRFGLWMEGAENLGELNSKLREKCMIRRKKEDVLKELPPKRVAIVPIEITNRAEYIRAESEVISWLKERAMKDESFLEIIKDLPVEEQQMAIKDRGDTTEERARKAEELVRIEALKQLAAIGKLEAVNEWIDDFLENGEKLVVFASHIAIQKKIASWYGAAHIFGEDDGQTRQSNIDRFQNDPECRIIVCSLQAGGVGITLTAASNVVFVEQGWTPSIMQQAEDRLHRIGQMDCVTAWYLNAINTIDEEIAELIEKKRKIIDAAIDGQSAEAMTSILSDLINKLRNK